MMSTEETKKVIIVPNQSSFTPSEIRKLLGVSRNTVYYWLAEGKLPYQPSFFGGRAVFRADLVTFIEQYLECSVIAPEGEAH